MANKRIEYIDCLRGLCIFWVVWYHSSHPEWIEYPFRMPTLFFVSGIFYKQYDWGVFWRKKVNQYIVPFLFFYMLYYTFLLAINYLSGPTISRDILYSIFNLFSCYSGNAGYIVNYPLWFMIALLVLQTVTYIIKSVSRSNSFLLTTSVILTIVAHYWLWYIELPFFIGKALSFYIYYVMGVVIGKQFVNALEENRIKPSYLFYAIIAIVILVAIAKDATNIYLQDLINYVQFGIIPFALLYIFRKYITNIYLKSIFLFMGTNSLVIFGLHDMYLSIQRIVLGKFIDVDNVWIGLFMAMLTIIAVYPSVSFFEKYMPIYIGKKPLLPIKK